MGAGPAGLTAALYLARDGFDVLVIEPSTIGGQAFITNRLDNFPGFPEGITGEEFANNLKRQVAKFGVETIVPHKVVKIGPCHDNGSWDTCTFKKVTTDSGSEFTCKIVIVATGSKYRELIVPGYEALMGTSIHYCATCDGPFYRGKNIFVIGGGNSAFEEALWLKSIVNKITIIVRRENASASKALIEKVENTDDIEVWYNSEIVEVKGDIKLEKVKVKHKDQNEIKEYSSDGIFVFIGLTPNTNFLKDVVDLDDHGFIKTHNGFETSVKGIFAAGDCRQNSSKQAITAAGEGAAAALLAREFLKTI